MSEIEVLETLYRRYFDTFNNKNTAMLSGLFAFPVVIGGGGRKPRTIPDAETYLRFMQETLDTVIAQGWSHSVLDNFHVATMAGDTGVVTAHYRRCRADGTEIEGGTANYLLRKIDGAWKFVGIITP